MTDVTEEVIADFRRVMKAFTDTSKWPDYVIEGLMIETDCWTGGKVWGNFDISNDRNLKKRGWYYLTAHFLVSMYGDLGVTNNDPSNISSEARLNISAKTVADESVEYRITEMEDTVNDFIGTTIYGVIFMNIRNRCRATACCV